MKKYTGSGPEAFVFTTTRGQAAVHYSVYQVGEAGFAAVGKPDMRVHDLTARRGDAGSAGWGDDQGTHEPVRAHHASDGDAVSDRGAERDAKIAEAMSKLAAQT